MTDRRVTLAELWRQAHGRCTLCRQPIPLESASRDHVIPKSMGGAWSARNLRLACGPCNLARGDTFPFGTFRHLSESRQRNVWLRDGGACAECGYRRALVFCKRRGRRSGRPQVRLVCMSCLLGRPGDPRSPGAVASGVERGRPWSA